MKQQTEAFLTYIRCELNLSAHTVLSYKGDLNQWLGYLGTDDADPATIGINDLRGWVAQLASDGLTQRSIRRKIQTLRAFFTFMMKRFGLKTNPAAELIPGRMAKTLPRVVAPAITARVIDLPVDPTDFTAVRDRLAIDMLYSTGMRASELTGLLDTDVNCGKGELKVLGKRNKERIIPFGNELRQMIDQYRQIRPATASTAFFVRSDGRPMSYAMLRGIVRREFAGSGASPTPHWLRHSFATDMLNDGAGLNAVKDLLGHASLSTTQIYTHLSYSELKQNYQLAHPRAQKKR